jgi:hypothetical protein
VVQNDDKNTLPSSPHTAIVQVSPASGTRDSITAQTSLPEEKFHSTQPVVKKIIEHGDVKLIVPTAADKRDVHFVVSADILCAASKVWKVWFTGDATTLRESGSVNVPLCSGDLPAFELILSVLHYQTQSLPSPPSLDLIVQTTTLCDLYDLSRSLEPWIGSWLQQHSILELSTADVGLYIIAAKDHCKYLLPVAYNHAITTFKPDFKDEWSADELFHNPKAGKIFGMYIVAYGGALT